MPFIIRLLFWNISFASSFAIKSRYLCLYLVSMSFKPCHFSGKGLNDFERRVSLETLRVISPVRVLKNFPSAPMISPISKSSLKFHISSPTVSFLIYSCILAVWSFISQNMLLPCSLWLIILPAAFTSASSAIFPVSKSDFKFSNVSVFSKRQP